jgi:glucose/arabinose dehydrogenase
MKMYALLGAALMAASGSAAHAQLTTEVYQTGVNRPVFLTHAGDGSGRVFVVEQPGRIRIIDADGNLQTTPFLDISSVVTGGTSGSDERGLLGLAFHPDFETNGKFYVNYTTTEGGLRTAVEEYTVSTFDPNFADPNSDRRLMTIAQPYSNHNGGWLGFGPDGYLYIAMGDGGSGNDPGNRAQRLNFLLGKLLRIDVDNQDVGLAYAIPDTNPFANDGDDQTLAEIWDYGLRNPWRTSFDRDTGDLWIADVGQSAREEINFEPAGDPGGNHYGWRCREGFIATNLSGCPANDPLWVDPVHDYGRALGCSITGGYVYRGCELGSDYQGKYFFSDFCTGTIWYLDPSNGYTRTTAFDTNFNVSSFGEDENGELYIANLFTNTIYKLVLTNPDPSNCDPDCPADLAEPFGSLNFFDISAYLALYNDGDPAADLAEPFGSLNFFDISAYLTSYNAGCP